MKKQNMRQRKIGEFLQSLPVFWILVGIAVWAVLYEMGLRQVEDKDGYSLNVYTEFLGVAAGVLIVNTWYQSREERRRRQEKEQEQRQELENRLLREARSPESTIARNAFHEMKDLGLIYGESSILRGANLRNAKPGNVDLSNANLEGADLFLSDFSRSSFVLASLEGADLSYAQLGGATFIRANLRNANLVDTNLANVWLVGSNLEGAFLLGTKFDNTHFYSEPNPPDRENRSALYQPPTLPDGSRWTSETNMERFTNPDHPLFRLSNDPKSPSHCENHGNLAMLHSDDKNLMARITSPPPTNPT